VQHFLFISCGTQPGENSDKHAVLHAKHLKRYGVAGDRQTLRSLVYGYSEHSCQQPRRGSKDKTEFRDDAGHFK